MDIIPFDAPVSAITPLLMLAVLILGLALVVMMDRITLARRATEKGTPQTSRPRRAAAAPSLLALMAEREVIGQLSAAHLIRRRFKIS